MSATMESLRIEYTERAFRQDSVEAMGGDIVRALIEAITNSDDAYSRMDGKAVGKIWVGVDHGRSADSWQVVIRDRATGMSREEMVSRLARLGERTSGFELGKNVRGNRGRGAKDLPAFGDVHFESIKDNMYSQLTLFPNGIGEVIKRSRRATPEDRERLHIPRGNGTVVTIDCRREFKCPRHENLREALANDFQLRDIMSDPSRAVSLAKLNSRSTKVARLRHEVDVAQLTKLEDEEIGVPGYPDAAAHLTVYQLGERCDRPPSDPARLCGILIKGRRAIYDNTLFRYEQLPYAGWLTGRLECEFIDSLANEYDDVESEGRGHSALNPVPIISRRRQGLTPGHPFAKALRAAVEQRLAPLIEEMERRERASRQLGSAETRRALQRMGREAAKLMQQSLRELEEEEDVGHDPGIAAPIRIVPAIANVVVGETRTVSVVCDAAGSDEEDEVVVSFDPTGIVGLPEGSVATLTHHPTREDLLSAHVTVSGETQGEALLTAEVAGRADVGLVRAVLPPAPPEPAPPPNTLEFERASIRIGFGKTRKIGLRCPASIVAEHGSLVRVRSDSTGIVVLQQSVVLAQDPGGWFVGEVKIEGRALGAKGSITAELGGMWATCRAVVAERDDGVPELEIELSDEDPSVYRAYFDPPEPDKNGSQKLKILIRHPALQSVVGRELEFEHSPQWKAVLAEVVCDAMVRRLMGRKYPVSQEVDVQTLYRDHVEWMTRLLPRLQRFD